MYQNWNNDIHALEKRQTRQNYIKLGASLAFAALVGASAWQTFTLVDKLQAQKIDEIATTLTAGFAPQATDQQKQQAEKAYAQAEAANLTPILSCISQSREIVHVNEHGRDYYIKDQVNHAKAIACFNNLSERKSSSPLEKAAFSMLFGVMAGIVGQILPHQQQLALKPRKLAAASV